MCKSKAEGGQRCFTHARAKLRTAFARVAAADTSGDQERIRRAENALHAAEVEYASTERGQMDYQDKATQAAGRWGQDAAAAKYKSIANEGYQLRMRNALMGTGLTEGEVSRMDTWQARRAYLRDTPAGRKDSRLYAAQERAQLREERAVKAGADPYTVEVVDRESGRPTVQTTHGGDAGRALRNAAATYSLMGRDGRWGPEADRAVAESEGVFDHERSPATDVGAWTGTGDKGADAILRWRQDPNRPLQVNGPSGSVSITPHGTSHREPMVVNVSSAEHREAQTKARRVYNTTAHADPNRVSSRDRVIAAAAAARSKNPYGAGFARARTEAEAEEWAESYLSPENLHADGERSRGEAERQRRLIMDAYKARVAELRATT